MELPTLYTRWSRICGVAKRMRSCVAVRLRPSLAIVLILILAATLRGQDAPPTPLTMVSRDGRRTVPTTLQAGREVVSLDDIATLFLVAVKEDTQAGGVTISY